MDDNEITGNAGGNVEDAKVESVAGDAAAGAAPGAEPRGDIPDPFDASPDLDVAQLYMSCIRDASKMLAPVAVAVVLWVATAWIPFINIGTTIALFALPVVIARGDSVEPDGIFDASHRNAMKRFFLMIGWIGLSCTAAAAVCTLGGKSLMLVLGGRFIRLQIAMLVMSAAVPVWMLGTTWSMAPFLLLDKDMLAEDALKKSEEITEGRRLGIFCAFVAPVFIGLLWFRFVPRMPYIGWLLNLALVVLLVSIEICLAGKIYRKLRPADAAPQTAE